MNPSREAPALLEAPALPRPRYQLSPQRPGSRAELSRSRRRERRRRRRSRAPEQPAPASASRRATCSRAKRASRSSPRRMRSSAWLMLSATASSKATSRRTARRRDVRRRPRRDRPFRQTAPERADEPRSRGIVMVQMYLLRPKGLRTAFSSRRSARWSAVRP